MKTLRHICIAALTMLCISCMSASAPQKLDSFVDSTELRCDRFSAEDWNKSEEQYERLVNEYLKSGKSYSDAEKQMAARAMGRYHALQIKYGIEKSAEFLKNLGTILPSYLDGLASGLDENAGSIESALENLFDEEKLEKSLESLEKTLEGLFGE